MYSPPNYEIREKKFRNIWKAFPEIDRYETPENTVKEH